jgi:hypothetical protein
MMDEQVSSYSQQKGKKTLQYYYWTYADSLVSGGYHWK